MGDVNNGDAFCLQIFHNPEQSLYLVGGQGGGGFVQNQDLTVGRDSLGDFHGLHLRNAQLAQHLLGVEVHANFFQKFGGIGIHFVVVNHGDEAQQLLHGIPAQEDILTDGTGGNGLQLLVHHGDTHFQRFQRVLDIDLLALVNNFAFVHLIDAEHTLHERGFTGAVLAHQRVDLAWTQLKLCVVQSLHAGERFADTAHFQAVLVHKADLLTPNI